MNENHDNNDVLNLGMMSLTMQTFPCEIELARLEINTVYPSAAGAKAMSAAEAVHAQRAESTVGTVLPAILVGVKM